MVGGSAVLTRAHVVIVDDSLDRWKWALVGALLVVAVLLIIANMVKWRRGKHRADPAMKAAAEREVSRIAAASSIPGRMAMKEEQLAELKAAQEALLEGLRRTWYAAGQEPLPEMAKDEQPRLKVIDGGAA